MTFFKFKVNQVPHQQPSLSLRGRFRDPCRESVPSISGLHFILWVFKKEKWARSLVTSPCSTPLAWVASLSEADPILPPASQETVMKF